MGKRLFSVKDVRRIRSDARSQTKIAAEFGCSHVTISRIKNGIIYKGVDAAAEKIACANVSASPEKQ